MFKKIIMILMLTMLVGFSAEAGMQVNSDGKPVVSVASDCTWPPMEFINKDKQIVGFSVDLMKAAAEAGGYVVEIKNVAWDGIFAGLASGKYDCICSSVTINDQRKKGMDFSDPYFEVQQSVVTNKDSNAKTLADFKGKKLGAQIGTTGYFAVKKTDGVVAKSYDEVGLAMEDLYNGRISAVVCDDPIAADFALQQEEYAKRLKIAFVVKSATPEYLGVAVKKGNKEVVDLINKGLAAAVKNGSYDKIKAKWFGSN
ncbi:basic amino acid ABC transporter substrate-binding protein [Maridesulfovibrio ferrireducens]|uniref:basic amino acid ABC transporter substrate-binding protein n=1 Tax=Maridesulfovibrio ferrireducens TaxID=246191 RepID=UPI001A1D580C|nr:basic amino acid ABC transporter substrate-binding protein [Maridesulfovibrio ferrireducens]MBI9110394.1 basic amino acid ABC transporter substrate-binding protein [Maridesulfovibrio ferrireducens]